ncbi:hypothetical protein HYU06_05475 [Candidatus Woesearchaeota archaeon]|nr:hypothetical protein [Candidatus Woesearchaeota archaeon]
MRSIMKSFVFKNFPYLAQPVTLGIYRDMLIVQIQASRAIEHLKQLNEIIKITDLRFEKSYLLELAGNKHDTRKLLKVFAMQNIKIVQAYLNVMRIK